jgi:hypothetical protein
LYSVDQSYVVSQTKKRWLPIFVGEIFFWRVFMG